MGRAVHPPGWGKTENDSRFLLFSIACREYYRIRCLPFARSRDSDFKTISQHVQSPPELGATVCQNRVWQGNPSKSSYSVLLSIGFGPYHVSHVKLNTVILWIFFLLEGFIDRTRPPGLVLI